MDITLWVQGLGHGLPLSLQNLDLLNLDLLNLDLLNELGSSGLVFAQTFNEDILGNIGKSWDNFIRTGQVWALIIGFVFGYIFRSITSY